VALEKQLQIRYRDVSQDAHVHYAVYVSYIEEALRDLLDPILGAAYVVARIELDYRAPLVKGDDAVLATVGVERVGRSSVVAAVRLCKTDGSAVAEAVCTLVATEAGAARRLSDDERAALGAPPQE
jgi:acyl-CoA thioesterase FadM